MGATIDPKSIANAAKKLDLSGPASAISKVANTVSGGVAAVGAFFSSARGTKLPLPNPLFSYASYTYSLGISVLTTDDYNNPDSTYMAGKRLPLICKSANADPGNRVNTVYGKSDFFIDNLEIDSLIGNEKGNNTNATKMRFSITEPYSMGLFMISVQQAAQAANHPNWHDAPFLLTIQFRGNTETGSMLPIAGTTRFIPFIFTNVSSKVTGAGTVYECDALPYNAPAMNKNHASLKSDTSIRGKTVQQMLQTGENSLQVALNARAKQLKADKVVKEADEYLILFPPEFASSTPASGDKENKTTATTNTTSSASEADILKRLGVSRDSKTGLLAQSAETCNILGKANMNFSVTNKGDAPVGNEGKVYDEKKETLVRGNNVIDFKEGDFRFSQDSDVFNAINQVLLQSQFPKQTLDPTKLSKEGYKEWWRIETQVYIKNTDANDTSTGEKPKIIVYRIIPYSVHLSKVASNNVQAPGFEELRKQAVKVYNYIYTGKNVDILKFNIEYNASFYQHMNSDGFKRNQDVQTNLKNSGANEKKDEIKVADGAPPSKAPGTAPSATTFSKTSTGTDSKGGGGGDTVATRAARLFHDAITKGTDMQLLNMDIIGDPYYIAQSGQGNYTAKPTEFKNLNNDGTVNYQNGEVDIIVNFRSPTDINQFTGLYNIDRADPNKQKSTPVLGFSGLYQIVKVVSRFKTGSFTQSLEGLRRRGQENKTVGTKAQALNASTPATPPPAEKGK